MIDGVVHTINVYITSPQQSIYQPTKIKHNH